MRRVLFPVMLALLATFQYQIWFGKSSVRAINELQLELELQHASNAKLEERNRLTEIEVIDLKNGLDAVEERARSELGLIGQDEIFYQIID